MKIIIKERQHGKTFDLVKEILERNNDNDILFIKTSKQIDHIKNMIKFNDELKNIIVKNNNIEDFPTLKKYINDFCDNKVKPFCDYINKYIYNRGCNCFIDEIGLYLPNCKAITFTPPKEEDIKVKNKDDILDLIKIIRKGYYGNYHDMNSVSFEIGELLVKIEEELNK